MRCERERSADALCALALGTYVTVRSEPGEIIGHAAGTAVVRLRDSDRHVRVRPEALTTSHHQPMIDERLPEHDCLAFGVSENEAELFSSWVVDRLGLVFCSQGPLGSGVFVSTAQGRTCLLTAAHVLDEALKTGTIAVAACTAEPTPEGRRPARSPAIEYARRSRVAHAALLVMPRGFAGPGVLSFDDWRPDRDVLPSSSEALVSAGAPSDYVGDLNVAAKVLERLKVELLWSRSVGVNRATSELQIRASKYLTGVTSFEGMSGGPVFSVQSRRLLGINASEQGGFFEGIVNVTSRGSWMDFADEDA